jgi:molybdate transport system regulatory protein
MPAPVIRFRVDFANGCYVGPGKIDLLEAIHRTGSLSQAARDLHMSYRRAWLLTASLKSSFRESVTVAATGGKGGGGVTLTAFGKRLIRSYRELEHDIALLAARRLGKLSPAVKARAAGKSAASPRPLARKQRRKSAAP